MVLLQLTDYTMIMVFSFNGQAVAPTNLVFPYTDGSANQVLETDGVEIYHGLPIITFTLLKTRIMMVIKVMVIQIY